MDLSTGVLDRLVVTGSSGAESISFGATGADLNGDDDADMALTGVELATVRRVTARIPSQAPVARARDQRPRWG